MELFYNFIFKYTVPYTSKLPGKITITEANTSVWTVIQKIQNPNTKLFSPEKYFD